MVLHCVGRVASQHQVIAPPPYPPKPREAHELECSIWREEMAGSIRSNMQILLNSDGDIMKCSSQYWHSYSLSSALRAIAKIIMLLHTSLFTESVSLTHFMNRRVQYKNNEVNLLLHLAFLKLIIKHSTFQCWPGSSWISKKDF